MKQKFLIIVVALLALCAGLGTRSLISDSLAESQATRFPEFSLKDLAGKTRHIKEWEGRVLVINFWATWCPPCLKEMPVFNDLQDKIGSKDLQVIGIALDELEPVKAFIENHKIGYPILLGEERAVELAQQLGNVANAVPFTLIVNKQGEIVYRKMGELSSDDLMQAVKPLLP